MRPWLVFIATLMLLAACGPSEKYIKSEIEKANYCTTADDCMLAAMGKCPFGCYVYVNKAEAERIKSLIEQYETAPKIRGCEYLCAEMTRVECKDGKCE